MHCDANASSSVVLADINLKIYDTFFSFVHIYSKECEKG